MPGLGAGRRCTGLRRRACLPAEEPAPRNFVSDGFEQQQDSPWSSQFLVQCARFLGALRWHRQWVVMQ